MSKTQTLQERLDALSTEVDNKQVEYAERKFEVKLDDRTQVKTIMEHLNKSYSWKTQNAAAIVTLYDNL